MDLGLKSRRALVLGSSSGLGLAVARTLAAEGADVAIAGRDSQKLSRAKSAVGARAAISGHLTDDGEAARIVDQAARALGGLDILIVNTGGGAPGLLGDTTSDSRENAYRSMLRPALDAAVAGIPHLKKSNAARLLFITARSVLEASTDLALSSVYRSGVAAAARSLALELAPSVLVNVLVPGQFDTPAYHRFRRWLGRHKALPEDQVAKQHFADIPLGRLGTAEEFADVVTFYCSARTSFVTGSVIRIDGGAVTGFH